MKPSRGLHRAGRAIAVSIACMLAVAVPAGAQRMDDDFADFRIPDHRWRVGTLGASGSYSRSRASYGDVIPQGTRGELFRGDASGSAMWQRDSDPVQHTLRVDADTYGARQWSRSHAERPPDFSVSSFNENRTVAEVARVRASWRRYPTRVPFALGVSGALNANYGQRWIRHDGDDAYDAYRVFRSTRNEQWTYRYRGTADVFAGWGRVRNVTGIYDAYVLEERLRASGSLTQPLSAEARQRLASLFYIEPAFATAFERPDKRFWQEVERLLREDGALGPEGMSAADAYRAAEDLGPAVRLLRRRGTFIGPVAGAEWLHVIDRLEVHDRERAYLADTLLYDSSLDHSSRFDDETSQIVVGVLAEFHRPIGWRWQLDALTRVTTPLQRVSEGLDAASSIVASYIIADRWAASATAAHNRTLVKDDDGVLLDEWDVTFGARVTYYIENRLRATAGISTAQRRDRRFERVWQGSDRFDIGLTYAFMRGLDAPGLFDPIRP